MNIRIVISGRGYHAVQNLPNELELTKGQTVDDALEAIRKHLPQNAALPANCLVAVSGKHVGTVGSHTSTVLIDGDEVVIVAPVAGG